VLSECSDVSGGTFPDNDRHITSLRSRGLLGTYDMLADNTCGIALRTNVQREGRGCCIDQSVAT
jgi:hypothetical protein